MAKQWLRKLTDRQLDRVASGKNAEWWQVRLEEELAAEVKQFGVDGSKTQTGRAGLAKHLETNEKFMEARQLRIENLESLTRSNGPADLKTAFAHQDLANNYGMTGEYKEARFELQQVYEIRLSALGPQHDQTNFARDQLATVVDLLRDDGETGNE